MSEELADKLERLCCAETEGKFFDCVTDNIGTIVQALRLHAKGDDRFATALERIADAMERPKGAGLTTIPGRRG